MALSRWLDWLEQREPFVKQLEFLFLISCMNMLLMRVGVNLYHVLGIDYSSEANTVPFGNFSPLEYLSQIPWNNVQEELRYRLIPLAIPILGGSRRLVLPMALASSVSFGVLHGGLVHIPLQGVMGVFFSIIFLKCGGMQKRFVRATSMAIFAHMLYDAAVYLNIV